MSEVSLGKRLVIAYEPERLSEQRPRHYVGLSVEILADCVISAKSFPAENVVKASPTVDRVDRREKGAVVLGAIQPAGWCSRRR
jgi:hypothetical protein